MRDLKELLENQRETIIEIPTNCQQKTRHGGLNNSALLNIIQSGHTLKRLRLVVLLG